MERRLAAQWVARVPDGRVAESLRWDLAAAALALLAGLTFALHVAFRRGRPWARRLAYETDSTLVFSEPLGYLLLPVASFLSVMSLAPHGTEVPLRRCGSPAPTVPGYGRKMLAVTAVCRWPVSGAAGLPQ